MTLDLTPSVTGPLIPGDGDHVVLVRWLGETATGDEYGGNYLIAKVSLAGFWGVQVHGSSTPTTPNAAEFGDSLQGIAASLAIHVPAVPVERPQVPELTGDLLEDARRVTGLTLDQIGRASRVSGRAVAGWRAGTVPRHRENFLQALRSIGLSLVGGLGPSGVQRWFLTGVPSRLDRVAAGDVEGVAAEARRFETSPAT